MAVKAEANRFEPDVSWAESRFRFRPLRQHYARFPWQMI